jgi:signal transduction histidine kinase
MSKKSKIVERDGGLGPGAPGGAGSGTFSSFRAGVMLVLFFCVVIVVGVYVTHDIRNTGVEAEKMYEGSVRGLHRLGDLEYAAQETRRITFYALSTKDSNLHVKYADESREADHQVTEGINKYLEEAKLPGQVEVGKRLEHDWAAYLSVRDEVLASILEGSTREAIDLELKDGLRLFDRVRKDLEEMDGLCDEQASEQLANVAANSRRTMIRLAGVLGITLAFAVVTVWAIQRSQLEGALQLAKLQMEFVASVSHELRTPLAVISSAADNIADGLVEGKGEQKAYGAAIRNQSRQMTELVNQILLFAATKERGDRYVRRTLQVAEIVDSAAQKTSELVKRSGFLVELRIEPGLPLVRGDLSALSQCLQNLIGNAVKYSGESRWIGVSAFLGESSGRGAKEIRIAVQDHGIGIGRSELAHIFEPFYRSPAVRAEQIRGTGLGLSLSKSIAEAMGGRLTITSELGMGSTFTLHLPIAEGEKLRVAAATSGQDAKTQI